ncbi:thermonuclease family protein [Nitrosopumilus sp.]|uniref:thermonuclease family protein n=1 Tax=Nitrosopumilus sp. TaxID=2024843 RepID=UPI003B5B1D22
MKLHTVPFLLLGISMVILSIHDAYAQTEDEKNKDYRVYQNDAIGMILQYPDDWNLMESNRPDLPFVVRIWAPGNTGLVSMDHVYRDTNLSPEEIASSQVKMLETKAHDLKIIESKFLLVSNLPSWQLTYSTGDNAGHRLVESTVYVTNDNSRYIFSYSVWDGFPDYLPVFDSMIDSVQINSIYAKDSSENSSETSQYVVPDWMEHNARWWNEGQIGDQEMISTILFLADNKIITMPSEKEIDAYKISQSHYSDYEVYDMIKHNAWNWAESDLGEENFLKGIGYLASLNSQDEPLNESRNPDSCPQSFSSRCFTGTVTEIVDGDTVRVDTDTERGGNGGLIHLVLVSSPELDEEGGKEAKKFLEQICQIGSDALVDQDDLRPLDGPASGKIMAVVYCNGVNLNEFLLDHEFASFDDVYCYTSEFADENWAREGCSEQR